MKRLPDLAFGEVKPYNGSLKDGRLDLGLNAGDEFPLWALH